MSASASSHSTSGPDAGAPQLTAPGNAITQCAYYEDRITVTDPKGA